MIKNIIPKLSPDLGIDLGTSNTLVYLRDKGIVVNEPSVVAINKKTGDVLAIGKEAEDMIGRTPEHIEAIRPIANGVISDFELTEEMLRYFFRKFRKSALGIMPYRITSVITVPCGITDVERRAVEDAALNAGSKKVYLVENPIAAAIGSRIPISDPSGNIIVDIGGGTSEIAIISLGGIVECKCLKTAGQKFNEDIVKYIRDEHRLLIGDPTAERIKLEIGSARPIAEEKTKMTITGRNLSTGLPKEIEISSKEIAKSIEKSLKILIDAIHSVIENAPPEIVADIHSKNIWLSGGGSLLKGLDRLIKEYCEINVKYVDDPLTAAVRGTGIILENIDKYKTSLIYEDKSD